MSFFELEEREDNMKIFEHDPREIENVEFMSSKEKRVCHFYCSRPSVSLQFIVSPFASSIFLLLTHLFAQIYKAVLTGDYSSVIIGTIFNIKYM